MIKTFESVDDLKRRIYLWIIPCIVSALLLNTILQSINLEHKLDLIINTSLIFWFSTSWIVAYKNRFIPLAEFLSLGLISIYHIITVIIVINNLVEFRSGSLGDFIIWTPLYLMFIFLTLGTKRGLIFSLAIFLITFIYGILNIHALSSESVDSIIQFYFANIVYIVVLYFAQHIFRSYAENAVLRKFAYIDSLTGIANRHQIDFWLENKIMNGKENKESFSIIFFDIDHFKQINDTYGHKIGDSVLKELAALIVKNLSAKDLFGRWGGEEFIVITNAKEKDAYTLAEQLRQQVSEHDFKDAGKLTASFGVTVSRVSDTIDSILNRADKGLYQSKEAGRNQVNQT